jgi:hypothetical protein
MLVTRLQILIATFWIGSLWTIGYLVAPTLFAALSDRSLAGSIAGQLFRAEAWLSIACGATLIALQKWQSDQGNAGQRKWCLRLIYAMLGCTLLGYFGLQPFMAELRATAGAGGVMSSDVKMQFGILHGISSALYLVESLLGAALILKMRAP